MKPENVLRAAEAHLASVQARQDELDEAAYWDEAAIQAAESHRREFLIPAMAAVDVARAAIGLPSLAEEKAAQKKAAQEKARADAERRRLEAEKRQAEEAARKAAENAELEAAERARGRAEFESAWPERGLVDAHGRRYAFVGTRWIEPRRSQEDFSSASWSGLGHGGDDIISRHDNRARPVDVYVDEDGRVYYGHPIQPGERFAEATHWGEEVTRHRRRPRRFEVSRWEADKHPQWVPAGAADPWRGYGVDHPRDAETWDAMFAARAEARRQARERAKMAQLEAAAEAANPFSVLAQLKKG